MKKLGKLKLNALNEQNLIEKQMNSLKGGNYCRCSCYWESQGYATVAENRGSNYASNYTSEHGDNYYWMDDRYCGEGTYPGDIIAPYY
jgi:natural product precursor